MEKVKIVLTHENSKLPKKKYSTDACYDVWAVAVHDFGDGRFQYNLGIKIEAPEDCRVDLRARSSVHETGLILSNGLGTGDEGYTGELSMVFYHVIPSLPPYKVGDKVGQIHIEPRYDVEFVVTDELQESERGENGYGHSGNS